MWKIPMAEQGGVRKKPGDNGSDYSDLRSLPAFYMDDYSLIGILVDRMDEAISVIRSKGYAIEASGPNCPTAITVSESGEIRNLVSLLAGNGISAEIGDTVGEVYRGG